MISARGLTQREVAKRLRISQPRVSDLMRGRIDLFSVDSLIEMLTGMGASVRVMVKARVPRKRVA
jgi:predicted XRE-type DNA-binding protein